MKTRLILAGAALAALAACAHPVDTAGAPNFGAAVERNMAAQAIPTAASTQAPESGGATGALAQQRYKTGNTRPLMSSSTSNANPSH